MKTYTNLVLVVIVKEDKTEYKAAGVEKKFPIQKPQSAEQRVKFGITYIENAAKRRRVYRAPCA